MTSLSEWFDMIKHSTYSDKIIKARISEDPSFYDYVKQNELPCVTFNFIFDGYKKDANIISSTGFLYMDIDNPLFDIDTLDKNKVLAYFHSFGGQGWSIIVRVDNLTKENFKHNYKLISKELGLQDYVDQNAIKASQYNVLSYDPNIYINENPIVFTAVEVENVPASVVYKRNDIPQRKTLRFNNLDEFKIEGEYLVDWSGMDWITCWMPIIKKMTEDRHKMLLSYTNNLKWLNPDLTKEKALAVLKGVTRYAFVEPVKENKLNSIIDSVFKYHQDETLKPIYATKQRKIIFAIDSEMNKEEKLGSCRKEYAIKRTEESKQKINDIIDGWDYTLGKITIKKIATTYNMSKKTVDKYWSLFKAKAADKNKSLKIK